MHPVTEPDRCQAEQRLPLPSPRDPDTDRREFLKRMGTLSTGLALAHLGCEAAQSAEDQTLPQIPFGKYCLSRLICGSNCFGAGSHLSVFVNNEMRSYYTPDQVAKTLRRCEAVGINCWQMSGLGNVDVYRRLVDEGSRMQIISLGRDPKDLPALAQAGCIGVAHHGEVTDQLFKAGKLDEIREFLKQVRDAGMLAGVSTHMPAVVDAIESKGWDLDYYQTCVYERHRSEAELEKLLGHVPLPVGEVFLKSDPPRMFKAIQQTRRPCLAFKILAAGRRTDVEQAFRETFAAIKPTDAVIVGIYDRYSDQAGQNAEFVRRFGSRS
jgi:hypothetical protein